MLMSSLYYVLVKVNSRFAALRTAKLLLAHEYRMYETITQTFVFSEERCQASAQVCRERSGC
jgi:hypothetical protein